MSDTASSITQMAIGLLLGALGGGTGTLVATRTRFSNMQRDIRDEAKERSRLEEQLVDRINSIQHRQMIALKLTADIARKVGVDGRQFDDALVRMLTDDNS